MKLDYQSPPEESEPPPRGRRHPAEVPVAIFLWLLIAALLCGFWRF